MLGGLNEILGHYFYNYCACVLRSVVYVPMVYAHMYTGAVHTEARGRHGMFYSSTLCFTEPESKLSPASPLVFLSLPPWCQLQPYLAFTLGAEVQTQILMLAQQVFFLTEPPLQPPVYLWTFKIVAVVCFGDRVVLSELTV